MTVWRLRHRNAVFILQISKVQLACFSFTCTKVPLHLIVNKGRHKEITTGVSDGYQDTSSRKFAIEHNKTRHLYMSVIFCRSVYFTIAAMFITFE